MRQVLIFMILALRLSAQEIPIFRLEPAPDTLYTIVTDSEGYQTYIHVDSLFQATAQVLSKAGAVISLSGGGGSVTLLDDDPNNEKNQVAFSGDNFLFQDNAGATLQTFNKNNFNWWQKNASTQALSYTAGEIGVGTTTPTRSLDVFGDARLRGNIYDSNNNTGSTGQVITKTSTGWNWATSGASNWTVTGGNIYRLSNVGVGTTNPVDPLQVDGNGVLLRLQAGTSQSTFIRWQQAAREWYAGVTVDGNFSLLGEFTPRMTINYTTGAIGFDGRITPVWTGIGNDVSTFDQVQYDFFRESATGELKQRYANVRNVRESLSGNYTLTATDEVVRYTGTGTITVTLPTATGSLIGKTYTIIRANSNGTINISGSIQGRGTSFSMTGASGVSAITLQYTHAGAPYVISEVFF
jgi:hypothetical protein